MRRIRFEPQTPSAGRASKKGRIVTRRGENENTVQELKRVLQETPSLDDEERTRLLMEIDGLVEAQAELAAILTAFDGLIYICSRDYTIERMNQKFIERTGRYPIGEKCFKALHDRDDICPWCVNDRVFRGEKIQWEVLSPKDNRYYSIVNAPIYRPDGRISKIGIIRDITALKQTDKILEEQGERYKTLFEHSRDAIAIAKTTGEFVEVNQAFLDMFGYSRSELMCTNASQIWADPRDRIAFQENLEKKGAVRDYEWKAKRKDGSELDCLLTASVRYDENGNVLEYHGIIRDITEMKNKEKALRRSEERYRAIVEDQIELVCRFRRDGILTFVNDAYSRYFSHEKTELLGRSFFEFIPESDRAAVARHIESLSPEQPVRSRTQRIVTASGETRWQQWTDRALFDSKGQIIEFQSVGRDMTDLVQAQEALQSRTQELERSNKDLEQFAYIAAHDLREPLLAVAAYLKVLQRRLEGRLDPETQKLINGAMSSTFRMDSLIQNLLAYSRIGQEEPCFTEINSQEILCLAMANLQSAIEETKATITYDPLPAVVANASQLVQLFQNLLSNAIKFRGEHPPKIHVGVTRVENAWQYFVRDNGIGIEPPYFDRIFLLFQRIKNRAHYPGAGIGLANCRRIIEYHGGKIWVESSPGSGSTFFFTIPDRRDAQSWKRAAEQESDVERNA